MQLQEIIAAAQDYLPESSIDLIRKAHAFAFQSHKGQTRASGEPYISHLQEVAYLATKLRLDAPSIATALLHDTVEDTPVTLSDLQGGFGKDIADLVDGVTKLNQVKFSSREEAQAENFRKMLLAMSKDIRILMLKLCDRLHNMRTLEYLSEARRSRIAQETLDIYAPLAHRLGIYWMKSELEDLSLRFLRPAIYNSIKEKVAASRKEREFYIQEVVNLISKELKQNEIEGEVSGRPKHFFSIYQKMEKNNLDFDEIYDLIAFRIVAQSTRDCYAALGVVHAGWKPIPGRFKDYIAMPKSNGYQSLHTTVIGPRGHRIEIQIRSPEMHDIAERGIAAHWVYKEFEDTKRGSSGQPVEFAWIKDLIESEKMLRDPVEFMSMVKEDLFPQEVFVFSPKGDLIALPKNSTPIDFAFHIHSQIGERCSGARVNGQQVPLAYKLQNGDTVEITTSENQSPSKDWLNLVATSKAKQRIRVFVRAEERSRSIAVGKELLTKDLRKVKMSLQKVTKDGSLLKIAEDLGLKEVETLFAEIGYGKLSTKAIVAKLVPNSPNLEETLGQEETALQKIFQKAAKALREKAGVKVHGLDDMVFRFARCCQPLPGDELVGYVTRGRGVVVHTRGCTQTMSFDPRRLIAVGWDDNVKTVRSVRLRILSIDKIGILAALTQSISGAGANILNAQVSAKPNKQAICTFEINVESAEQLKALTRNLERIDGVIRVERYSGDEES